METDELIKLLIDNCIDGEYNISSSETEKTIRYTVEVDSKQFGKIVGRGGRVAEAIRGIVNLFSKTKKKVYVQINNIEK